MSVAPHPADCVGSPTLPDRTVHPCADTDPAMMAVGADGFRRLRRTPSGLRRDRRKYQSCAVTSRIQISVTEPERAGVVSSLVAPADAVIQELRGRHAFLSNYFERPLILNGIAYPSAEHAFGTAKATDLRQAEWVRSAPTPGEAKKRGRGVTLRPDWETCKVEVMRRCVAAKFADPGLGGAAAGDRRCPLGRGRHLA